MMSEEATLHAFLGLDKDEPTKLCIGGCNRVLPLNIQYFGKHSHHKDGFDSRCRDCVKRQALDRKRLKRESPTQPDACEVTGEVTANLVLDHDHKNNTHRGYIKDSCNKAIGQLGDTLDAVTLAWLYLARDSIRHKRFDELKEAYSKIQELVENHG